MKTAPLISLHLPCFVAGVLLTLGFSASAAVTEKETIITKETTTAEIAATGKVFSVEPGMISVVMKDNPTPVQFSYSKETPILDEKGTPIPLDLVRVDLPLTVHYVMEGEKMAARRVVISRSMIAGDANEKPEKKRKELAEETSREGSRTAASAETGPLEMSGSLSSIEQTISVVPRGESTPTMCVVNSSTRFVNIAGQPVGTQMLAAGMPMTVKSVRDGKRLIAREVIFHGNPSSVSGGAAYSSNGGTSSGQGAGSGDGTTSTSGGTANSGNLSDVPNQGYILPGQLPGQIGPRPVPISSGAGNPNQSTTPGQGPNSNQGNSPNQGTNPNQGANPNQGTNPNPGLNPAQPGTSQPNTPPSGNPSRPDRNGGGTSGTGGNNNGGSQPGQNGGAQPGQNGNGNTGSGANRPGSNGSSGSGNSGSGGARPGSGNSGGSGSGGTGGGSGGTTDGGSGGTSGSGGGGAAQSK